MKAIKIIQYIIIGILFIFSSSCNPKKWTQLEKNEALECLQSFQADSTYNSTFKHDVLISDEETAINIAEIYLFKIYGKQEIVQERPYKIGLIKNYWVITGSFKDYNETGGTFEIVIDANDGAVKGITHEK